MSRVLYKFIAGSGCGTQNDGIVTSPGIHLAMPSSPTVTLTFGPDEIALHVPADQAPWSLEDARRWLDAQFVDRECEPLRASGKVLTADKVITIAEAIGPREFTHDAALGRDFALAATAALARPQVHIDVGARTLSY